MRDVVITYSVAIEPDHTAVQATPLSVITVCEPSCKGESGINSLRLPTSYTLYRNNTSHEPYTRAVFYRRSASIFIAIIMWLLVYIQ